MTKTIKKGFSNLAFRKKTPKKNRESKMSCAIMSAIDQNKDRGPFISVWLLCSRLGSRLHHRLCGECKKKNLCLVLFFVYFLPFVFQWISVFERLFRSYQQLSYFMCMWVNSAYNIFNILMLSNLKTLNFAIQQNSVDCTSEGQKAIIPFCSNMTDFHRKMVSLLSNFKINE